MVRYISFTFVLLDINGLYVFIECKARLSVDEKHKVLSFKIYSLLLLRTSQYRDGHQVLE
jgi:hypothetical protein